VRGRTTNSSAVNEPAVATSMTAAIGTALDVPIAPTSGAVIAPNAKFDAPINPAAVPALRPWLARARIGTFGSVKPTIDRIANNGTTTPANPNPPVAALTSSAAAAIVATMTPPVTTRCGP
jgi:hypothetical protein